jgi:hypothetical protein
MALVTAESVQIFANGLTYHVQNLGVVILTFPGIFWDCSSFESCIMDQTVGFPFLLMCAGRTLFKWTSSPLQQPTLSHSTLPL